MHTFMRICNHFLYYSKRSCYYVNFNEDYNIISLLVIIHGTFNAFDNFIQHKKENIIL